jgi:hypothetical protein
MIHVMHDLETLSLEPNAVILSLGAVRFTIEEGIVDKFYSVINLISQKDRHISLDTLKWWMQQDKATFTDALKGEEDLRQVLFRYRDWFDEFMVEGVWANGSDFDNVLLTNAYKSCDVELPWHFTQHRCYRTIKSMWPEHKLQRMGTHHNALDDAVHQANHLILIAQKAGLSL